jgi:hypothetical protein
VDLRHKKQKGEKGKERRADAFDYFDSTNALMTWHVFCDVDVFSRGDVLCDFHSLPLFCVLLGRGLATSYLHRCTKTSKEVYDEICVKWKQ